MMNRPTKISWYFQAKIHRIYCKLALAKKHKILNAMPEFEKKFLAVLRRVCLLADSEFNYGYRYDSGRFVSNSRLNVTIQIRGNEIKFFDSDMVTIFISSNSTVELAILIFDRATERRANKMAELIAEMQLAHIIKIEGLLLTTVRHEPIDIKYAQTGGQTLEIVMGG
jgi:hypothetical protein